MSLLLLLKSAAAAKTLPADAGSYAVTGTAANLKFGRKVLALSGTYSVTGTDASLEVGRKIVADAGSYAITGATASLLHGWKVAADGGTYTVSGTDATLTKSSAKALAADGGTYAITGTAASLFYGREALALAGSYAVSGTDATLLYGREVLALAGSYAVTGTDASLSKSGPKSLTVDGGTYTITGTDASLVYRAAGQITPPQRYGGGGAPIWSEVSWFKKKKPKKEELVAEVAEVVEQAIPQVTQDESRVVAQRIVQQLTIAQLRQFQTLNDFIARVEAEIAEMDDEEVLLLAA